MPHTPETDVPVTNRNGVDPRAGDLDNVTAAADANANVPEGANNLFPPEGIAEDIEDDEEQYQSRAYGIAVGALVFAIAGLICRRLFASAFTWDNVFN